MLAPAPTAKKIRNDGKHLLLTRSAASEASLNITGGKQRSLDEWICAGYGAYFCILVIVFTFLCSQLVSLQDCYLSLVPVHPLRVTAVADVREHIWLQNILARPSENTQLQSAADSDREKTHLRPL